MTINVLKAPLALLFIPVVFAAVCSGQTATPPSYFPSNADAPPASLPPGCSAPLMVEIDTLKGTSAYRSMRREIAALNLGHTAAQQLQAAFKKQPQTSHIQQLVTLMTGLTDAENSYLCASFLIGREATDDDQ